MRRMLGVLLSVVMGSAALAVSPSGGAVAETAAIDPAVIGTTAATAAGSCWEIKQSRPAATDGSYWLLTPAMSEPQQFYCDMTTDGGGWVLVGKGRDAWVDDTDGKGVESDLLTPTTATMSATTVELSSGRINQLLNNGRLDGLTDGVRLRRATNIDGTAWQEARIKYTSRSRWAWTFGAEWPISSYSFATTTLSGSTSTTTTSSGAGGTSPSFGTDDAYNRVLNTTSTAMGNRRGFAYGSKVTGSSASTSYLYSATNGAGNAIPYTTVYLRPKVLSTDAGFTSVPDNGKPAVAARTGLKSTAIASPWGVSGLAGSTAEEGDVEVQAFTQSGNTMYVGGNFKYVQQDAAGTGQVQQSFLAAFDVSTGNWVSTFRPVLNEQVRALATLPSGQVVVGGDFTSANGQPASAIVALDPTTGTTSSTWKVGITNNVTGSVLRVNALDVQAPYVYIGGNLTHFTGGTRTTPTYMRELGRVSSTDGTPSTGWNPNLNGAVAAVDASTDGTRVYASGYFTTENGAAAKNAAAIMNTAGAPLATPAWSPTWSAAKSYQQAILEVGSTVWVGGSEHSLFQFDRSTFVRGNGDIMKSHGDIQAITASNGLVYAGCHCNQYDYSNAYTWSTLSSGWTQADPIGWFGAWDATTGARAPGFVPTFTMRADEGIWALKADSTGTMWAGGDIATVRTAALQARWSGGFARFAPTDSTPPPTPTAFAVSTNAATTVTLSWKTVTDTGGGVRYEVLRDDRPIGLTTTNTGSLTVPKGGSNRFFVRAVDAAGNVSATSPVLVPAA